jgi:hypothetical protein
MAQVITFTCDFGDTKRDAVTVPFSIGGTDYEIDVCAKHKREMDELFASLAAPARRAARRQPVSGHTPRGVTALPAPHRASTGGGGRTAEIRSWAKGAGIEISDRGRIPQVVEAKFLAASATG